MIAPLTRLAILGAALALAGCTTPMFTMPPGPQAYRYGYYDGCESGYAYGGSPSYELIVEKPVAPGAGDYRAGWLAGFDRCLGNYRHIQHTVNFLLGPPL
jgi:hypothetical protein